MCVLKCYMYVCESSVQGQYLVYVNAYGRGKQQRLRIQGEQRHSHILKLFLQVELENFG